MADNVDVTAGSGTTVGSDDRLIDGTQVHVQRVAPHGTPAISVAQVEVSNSSTAILAVDDNRHSCTLVNRQLVAVFIDDATATTSAFRLDPGDSITLPTSAVINGITAAAYTAVGDAKVHVISSHD
jgi:hypothetical protein